MIAAARLPRWLSFRLFGARVVGADRELVRDDVSVTCWDEMAGVVVTLRCCGNCDGGKTTSLFVLAIVVSE